MTYQAISVSSPFAKVRADREERASVLVLAVLLDSVESLSNSNKKGSVADRGEILHEALCGAEHGGNEPEAAKN